MDAKLSLTNRASFTFISNLLKQLAQLINGLVITPIVIVGLGAELYGAWQMIQRTMQYLARSDLRPLGTLRVFLATSQNSNDHLKKKKLIGAAFLVNLCIFPIIAAIGFFLIYNASSLIRVAPEFKFGVQLAMIIAVLRVGLDKVLGIPGSILAGVNLEYKAMWVSAFSILAGGMISIVAIKSGWGLPGIACATLLVAFMNGGIRFIVAKKNISWLGIAKPRIEGFKRFVKSSGWFLVSSYSDAFLNFSDLLIIGIILGPSSAGIYAATGAVLRMIIGPMQQIAFSASSGIGYLCEIKAWERLAVVRQDVFIFSILVMTVAGAGIIGLNQTFLFFWIGDGFYAGNTVNVLLVFIAVVRVVLRIDYEIMDNLIMFKTKAVYQLICGTATLVSGILLTKIFGSAGMALSILCSQLILLILYRLKVQEVLINSEKIESSDVKAIRVCCVSMIIFFVSFIFCANYTSTSFLFFVLSACVIALFSFLNIWFVGINKNDRGRLSSRFNTVRNFRLVRR